jgi:hypothetical protein
MKSQTPCCEMMANQLAWKCDQHSSVFECPDALISKHKNEYGLIIHDGGSSSIKIEYCPWCGKKL